MQKRGVGTAWAAGLRGAGMVAVAAPRAKRLRISDFEDFLEAKTRLFIH